MNLKVLKVGYLKTNCYILEKNGCVLVIDPGDEYPKISEVIGEQEVVGVIVTHCHPDHLGALEYFEGDKVYMYPRINEDLKEIEPFKFEVIHTPGHASDSVTIYSPEDKIMFTGDFLFKDAIGRTDLHTSNEADMIASLKRISKYPHDVVVYPGHGGETTIGAEVANNRSYIEN